MEDDVGDDAAADDDDKEDNNEDIYPIVSINIHFS